MYRRRRNRRPPQYNYSTTHFPALGNPTKEANHNNWEQILANAEKEVTIIVDNDIFDNNNIIESEEMINEMEERYLMYQFEDDMRYGINRMNEWDRGYYEGNPYFYSWEYEKMHNFTEDLEEDIEADELD